MVRAGTGYSRQRPDRRGGGNFAAKRPLHILELDCIESYLAEPGLIARAIGKASAERGGAATPDATRVEALMLEESDKLKEATFDRASDRHQRDRHRATGSFPPIPEANQAARDLVNANWTDLRSRLRVLPGKIFLAAVRTRLQAEYAVSFGNPRLLEELTEAEIPTELAGVLRAADAGSTSTKRAQVAGSPPEGRRGVVSAAPQPADRPAEAPPQTNEITSEGTAASTAADAGKED